jgi:hypothetical protein
MEVSSRVPMVAVLALTRRYPRYVSIKRRIVRKRTWWPHGPPPGVHVSLKRRCGLVGERHLADVAGPSCSADTAWLIVSSEPGQATSLHRSASS